MTANQVARAPGVCECNFLKHTLSPYMRMKQEESTKSAAYGPAPMYLDLTVAEGAPDHRNKFSEKLLISTSYFTAHHWQRLQTTNALLRYAAEARGSKK